MARPHMPAGELGTVVVGILPSGRYRACASCRDDGGALHRLAAVADTEEKARAHTDGAEINLDRRRGARAASVAGRRRFDLHICEPVCPPPRSRPKAASAAIGLKGSASLRCGSRGQSSALSFGLQETQ